MNLAPNLFLFFSLPGVILGFTVCRKYWPEWAATLLLFASAVFYAVEDISDLPLLIASIIFNYWITGRIARTQLHYRAWAALGVAVNLFPLVWYKYIHQATPITRFGELTLSPIPLGLSFYTFQQITALFDIRREDAVRLSFSRYALFAGFFAQIPAGPISRYRDLAPQIEMIGRTEISLDAILRGVSLLIFGLAKKIILADKLGFGLNDVYAAASAGQSLGFTEAWLTAWASLLQLYFDFSAYSDMAIGLGLCFGLSLPVNFNSPLKAISASDFIDRWHMSMVSWLREYVYQPLFRLVRKFAWGASDTRRVTAWAVATIVSMGALGAWHGNQITLLIGGVIDGVLLVLIQLPSLVERNRSEHLTGIFYSGIKKAVKRITLLALVSALTLTMKIADLHTMLSMLRDMVDWRSAGLQIFPHAEFTHVLTIATLAATLIALFGPNTMQIFGLMPLTDSDKNPQTERNWMPSLQWGVAVGLLVALDIMLAGDSAGFIYARF